MSMEWATYWERNDVFKEKESESPLHKHYCVSNCPAPPRPFPPVRLPAPPRSVPTQRSIQITLPDPLKEPLVPPHNHPISKHSTSEVGVPLSLHHAGIIAIENADSSGAVVTTLLLMMRE